MSLTDRQSPILDYANLANDPQVSVEIARTTELIITVPTQRTLGRFLRAIASRVLWAIPLLPFFAIVYLLFATRRPRAVFRMTADELVLEESLDTTIGWFPVRHRWPLPLIGELRPNRFFPAMYVTIPSKGVMYDVLVGGMPQTLATVGKALDEARAKFRCSN